MYIMKYTKFLFNLFNFKQFITFISTAGFLFLFSKRSSIFRWIKRLSNTATSKKQLLSNCFSEKRNEIIES